MAGHVDDCTDNRGGETHYQKINEKIVHRTFLFKISITYSLGCTIFTYKVEIEL